MQSEETDNKVKFGIVLKLNVIPTPTEKEKEKEVVTVRCCDEEACCGCNNDTPTAPPPNPFNFSIKVAPKADKDVGGPHIEEPSSVVKILPPLAISITLDSNRPQQDAEQQELQMQLDRKAKELEMKWIELRNLWKCLMLDDGSNLSQELYRSIIQVNIFTILKVKKIVLADLSSNLACL